MSKRLEQTASVVQSILSNGLLKIKNPDMLTITRVEMSEDLKVADVWVGNIKNPRWSADTMKAYIPDFVCDLKANKLRFIPYLKFHKDESGEYIEKINSLIQKTHEH